ncbi:36087_t:CDS:2, partial [Gigaspora margarita]
LQQKSHLSDGRSCAAHVKHGCLYLGLRAHITNKNHCSWSVKEKLMVLCYLKRTNSVRATAKHFEIEPKQVCDWHNKKQELLNVALYVLMLNYGQQARYLLLEKKLVD